MYLSTTSVCSWVVKNGRYLSILSQLMALSVISLYIFEETYILLESPVHAELNGLCPNSVY